MLQIHLDHRDPTVDRLVKAAFPGFAGHDVDAFVQDEVEITGTDWQEGSKSTYVLVRLADCERMTIGAHPNERAIPIPPGFVVVRHDHFCGRQSVSIIGPPANITPMLPKPMELTGAERTVLVATKSLKSSYGGQKDFRFSEAHRARGITREDWDRAKANLITRKLLNAAGAITVDGRNAVGFEQL